MPHREADWEQALRHVRETEPLVAEQEARIEHLRAQGLPTEAAEDVLLQLQTTLDLMKTRLWTLTSGRDS
jgi:hypothetical protein